jgi:hypothetical protein
MAEPISWSTNWKASMFWTIRLSAAADNRIYLQSRVIRSR